MTVLEFVYLVLLFLAVAFEVIAALALRPLRYNFVAAGLVCFFLMLFIQALDRTFP